ncbi:MAG: hypothetical protein CMJ18_06665 [Phycisphaeraceae bacterium]|nr:hypothetical protein [Phycisphaeraceae bacterium]
MSRRDSSRRERAAIDWRVAWSIVIVLGLGAYYGYQFYMRAQERKTVALVKSIVEPEELIGRLMPRLRHLDQAALNLQVPDHDARQLFADEVRVRDLAPNAPAPAAGSDVLETRLAPWPVTDAEASRSIDTAPIWRGYLSSIESFEHAHFYIVRGRLASDGTLETDMGFTGLARTSSGALEAVHARQQVVWTRTRAEKDPWRITTWRQGKFERRLRESAMFRESLDLALQDPRDLERARTSRHAKLALKFAQGKRFMLPDKVHTAVFDTASTLQHPGLSVVDVDGDGLDDLYVMPRWGSNLLLHNQGGGRFRERAADFGLDIRAASTSAIFADFDNDGDPDLWLGRSVKPSMYLVNEDGRFVDRSSTHVSISMPYLVVSMSAADYNGDGLLDVYLARYALSPATPDSSCELMSAEHCAELERRTGAMIISDRFFNDPGPPNLLLENQGGGRFAPSARSRQVAPWFNSFQATWSDFDDDGDPDLYVTNDFAPDNLYRNDGPAGFVDVTANYGGEAMTGFGMGASWGDYDNDGRHDLYVSNMYSKAGLRITGQIDRLDRRFRHHAAGNVLLRNAGAQFDAVSGLEPPALTVAKAGWAWGGQFVDVDNDGFLDIYVTNGYYTAPWQVDSLADM